MKDSAAEGISVAAIGIAVVVHTDYVPLTNFPPGLLPRERLPAGIDAIPEPHLLVRNPEDSAVTTGPDVSVLALQALGTPAPEQPLFLVRSGPPRDTLIAPLARLVHETGWPGEDLGITHLDELGGTVIFDLLDWAVPDDVGATALICDEPLFADARIGRAPFSAVSLRVRRGPGPLRVLGCGEGAPGGGYADLRRFTGIGPCDNWLALHAALTAGDVTDGDEILLHTRGPLREGWLALQAVRLADLVVVDAGHRVPVGAATG